MGQLSSRTSKSNHTLYPKYDTVFDYEVEKGKFDEYAQEIGSKNTHGLHSMVLIGAYKEPSGKVWFTLQNTWKGKYIRKVSAEYMASCQAKIWFVPMDHNVSLSENFDLVDAKYAETAVETPEECVDAELEEYVDVELFEN
jgi:hypothetical protein